MTTTRIKDIVCLIQDEIEQLPPEKEGVNILVCVESQLAFDRLRIFLDKYSNSDANIAPLFIKKCCDFLSDRWFGIRHTDAIYSHHPGTIASRAYLILADKLGAALALKAYDLLMPSVGAISYYSSRDNLSCFKLHEFILGDDGAPIEVAKCLNDALNNKVSTLFNTNSKKRPLSLDEKERIINHSGLANAYYEAIVGYVKYNFQEYELAREAFNQGILQNSYQVRATYGEEGQIKLAKYIFASMKTQNDFVRTLATYVPQAKWIEFIDFMPTYELTNLVLENHSLINVLQKVRTYTGDEVYDKAMLFCLLEIYWRQRSRVDTLVGQIASYTKEMLASFTQEQKHEAVKLLQNFLMSNENYGQLNAYVKKKAKKVEHWKAMFEPGSNLALISEQIKHLTEPDFFTQKTSYFSLASLLME